LERGKLGYQSKRYEKECAQLIKAQDGHMNLSGKTISTDADSVSIRSSMIQRSIDINRGIADHTSSRRKSGLMNIQGMLEEYCARERRVGRRLGSIVGQDSDVIVVRL
jgi:hypothetical protein